MAPSAPRFAGLGRWPETGVQLWANPPLVAVARYQGGDPPSVCGAEGNDGGPYKRLKRALKAEINEEA